MIYKDIHVYTPGFLIYMFMKEYIIFYVNYPIIVNNKSFYAFDYFEYNKKYEIVESYETDKWDEYHRKISLGDNKHIVIYYNYDGKDFYDQLFIQDGLLTEFLSFPDYDFIQLDISIEREKNLSILLSDI